MIRVACTYRFRLYGLSTLNINAKRKFNTMANGTVKWFNKTKGYGFITPEDGSGDIFVHISAVQQAGLSQLNDGQKLTYEVVSNKGKTSATELKLVN